MAEGKLRKRSVTTRKPKGSGRKAAADRTPKMEPRKSAKPQAASRAVQAQRWDAWNLRHKKYVEVFGPAFPKGRVLLADGDCVTPLAGCRQGLCVMQYAPRPDRMSWVYVTHGLSQAAHKGPRSPRLELVLHWRNRESQAARILLHAARSMLEGERVIAPGTIISSRDIPTLSVAPLQHWLACAPDRSVPGHLEHPGGNIRFVLLLGITDAELQCALKVNKALADGSQVLLEAVRDGGVYPVSDPDRNCLTRRGDFLRLWETAFRTVRERTANGAGA